MGQKQKLSFVINDIVMLRLKEHPDVNLLPRQARRSVCSDLDQRLPHGYVILGRLVSILRIRFKLYLHTSSHWS